MDLDIIKLGIAWYAIFVFSTVCHEFAHAWSAWRMGDPTAHSFITLNPLPHIRRSPFGMVILPLALFLISKGGWMFGYASVPISVAWAMTYPRRSAVCSLCGPLANLLLAVVGLVGLALLVRVGGLTPQELEGALQRVTDTPLQAVAMMLWVLVFLNAILFCFNMIPLPPMDGSQVASLAVPRVHLRAYMEFVWNPYMGLTGLIVAYYCFPTVFGGYALPVIEFVLQWIVDG